MINGMKSAIVNSSQLNELFDKLRKAGHGAIIKFDSTGSGQPVEGIIFDPASERPSGFEDGIFVAVPSDVENIYYLDPEQSRKEGQLIVKVLPAKPEEQAPPPVPEDLLKEFEYIGQVPGVKRGGGATGDACSKHKGIIDLN